MAAALVRPPGGWPVRRAAEALGVPIANDVARALAEWLDHLVQWNARIDLTAARSPDELTDLMLADALVLSRRVPAALRVVDVGTGAGAPGLALALLRPDLAVTLVEPLSKRAAFLRTVKGALGLAHVSLDARKAAAVASSSPAAWDVALARATLPPTEWLELARALVKARGSAWVFLAEQDAPSDPAFRVAEEVAYEWPLTAARRRLVRHERLSVP